MTAQPTDIKEHTMATTPALIVNVSLASSDRDYDTHVTFLERELHLRRIGTNGDVAAARELGSELSDPFMTLGFLALPVIPDLKLTDQGLVDVTRFEIVPLFV